MKNWQTKKLGEVAHFYNGLWKGKKPPYIDVGVIRNTNFTKEGHLDDSNIAYLPVEKKQFENRQLQNGDIILEKSGGGPKQPVGRVIIFDRKEGLFSFSNFTSAIRVTNSAEIDYGFLFKFLYCIYLSGVTEKIQSNSTGIRNLDLNKYKEIEISYPAVAEQKRIIKILDGSLRKISKAKQNAEKNLQNSKDLFESYLQSVFMNTSEDWEEKILEDLCTKITDGVHKKPVYTTTGIPFIKINNLTDGPGISFRDVSYISIKDHEEFSKRTKPEKGDILITKDGTIGIVRVIERL